MSLTSPPLSTGPTFSTDSPTFTGEPGKKGPASTTLLFGSLVIFSSLFAAFLLLCFFWQYRRAQRRGVVLEYDETIGTYRGVPKMWEVWTQGEPSGGQRDLGNVRPLSADVEPASINPEPEPLPVSLPRRVLRNAFRRPVPSPEASPDGPETVASAPMNSLRMTFIVAMPYREPPSRRYSVLSQGPSVNGDLGQREYALGIYHAPFREETPVQP